MKKRMCAILILILFLLSFTGCSKLEVTGLENYRKETCSVSLTDHLFPSDDFLSRFEYNSGDYRYYDTGDVAWGYVTTLAYLVYSPEVYEEAKAYCLEEFELCEDHQYIYDQFVFQEHLCHTDKNSSGQIAVACCFPKVFNMFAYNDERCTLVFLGYYNGKPDDSEKQLVEEDFPAFLETVYSQHG